MKLPLVEKTLGAMGLGKTLAALSHIVLDTMELSAWDHLGDVTRISINPTNQHVFISGACNAFSASEAGMSYDMERLMTSLLGEAGHMLSYGTFVQAKPSRHSQATNRILMGFCTIGIEIKATDSDMVLSWAMAFLESRR